MEEEEEEEEEEGHCADTAIAIAASTARATTPAVATLFLLDRANLGSFTRGLTPGACPSVPGLPRVTDPHPADLL
jgi:hypothetical protein